LIAARRVGRTARAPGLLKSSWLLGTSLLLEPGVAWKLPLDSRRAAGLADWLPGKRRGNDKR
jgi:hypothetical protein